MTPRIRALYHKVILHAAEVKIYHAQTSVKSPHLAAPPDLTLLTFDERVLISSAVHMLPKPLAAFLDAIGHVEHDGRSIFPRLIQHNDPFVQAIVSASPTKLAPYVAWYVQFRPLDNDLVAATAWLLIEWLQQDGQMRLSQATAIFGRMLTRADITCTANNAKHYYNTFHFS